jgi:hypothetical protein
VPVVHVWTSGPTFDGGGVNVTLVTRGDDVAVAVLANPSALPEPAALIAGFHRAFDELMDLADADADAGSGTDPGTVAEGRGTATSAVR